MRARYTRSLGLPVLDEETGDVLGVLSGMVLQPDTGVVEGFFVRMHGWSANEQFLIAHDILHWGTRITIRHRNVLSSVDDLVRVQTLLTENRPVLGQTIVTENGRALGRCVDVQFSTESFRLEWLFPRRWFRWGVAIPASQILEVKPEAIVVKDLAIPDEQKDGGDEVALIPEAA